MQWKKTWLSVGRHLFIVSAQCQPQYEPHADVITLCRTMF